MQIMKAVTVKKRVHGVISIPVSQLIFVGQDVFHLESGANTGARFNPEGNFDVSFFTGTSFLETPENCAIADGTGGRVSGYQLQLLGPGALQLYYPSKIRAVIGDR
jgi:hypothetical protein